VWNIACIDCRVRYGHFKACSYRSPDVSFYLTFKAIRSSLKLTLWREETKCIVVVYIWISYNCTSVFNWHGRCLPMSNDECQTMHVKRWMPNE